MNKINLSFVDSTPSSSDIIKRDLRKIIRADKTFGRFGPEAQQVVLGCLFKL